MTVVATRPKFAHDWCAHEGDLQFSRAAAVVASGSGKVVTGTVMGRVTVGAATSAAKSGGNTGNGTLTLDATTPVLSTARAGVYTARCIAAAGNGGTFRIEDPSGVVLGDVAVGATWSEQIKLVIADGSSDFVVGDGFDITVAVGSRKVKPLNFAATDGTQNADCILHVGVDATSADVETAVNVRDTQVIDNQLIWPAGATTNQKSAAMAQLAAKGIISHQR